MAAPQFMRKQWTDDRHKKRVQPVADTGASRILVGFDLGGSNWGFAVAQDGALRSLLTGWSLY